MQIVIPQQFHFFDIMADVDSLHDLSDTEIDPNGLEVDADDEEAAEERYALEMP